jgi:Protein of unknown function (DUF3592)
MDSDLSTLGFNLLVIFGASAVAFGIGKLKPRLQAKFTRDWPVVEGTVENSFVESKGQQGYVAHMLYSYSVRGDFYSGDDGRQFATEAGAQECVQSFKGQRVFIRYNPNKPDKSVLWKRVSEINASGASSSDAVQTLSKP